MNSLLDLSVSRSLVSRPNGLAIDGRSSIPSASASRPSLAPVLTTSAARSVILGEPVTRFEFTSLRFNGPPKVMLGKGGAFGVSPTAGGPNGPSRSWIASNPRRTSRLSLALSLSLRASLSTRRSLAAPRERLLGLAASRILAFRRGWSSSSSRRSANAAYSSSSSTSNLAAAGLVLAVTRLPASRREWLSSSSAKL